MNKHLTPRIQKLRNALVEKGSKNRAPEWVHKSKLPNIGALHPEKSVVERKALAIDAMLKALCDPSVTGNTNCYTIADGELLAGNIPMGSNGLGKVFPTYLTEEEYRVGSVTNKTEMAILGHNSINYNKVVNSGLGSIIARAEAKLNEPMLKLSLKDVNNPTAFYKAVITSCKAVIKYAHNFASLAQQKAAETDDKKRKQELLRIAKICLTVPEHPATNFYEAIHSIWLVHCCLHSTMDFMSLGRLDQVLNPFLEKESLEGKELAQELMENFIIKAAGRLNFTTEYLVEQDHMDYNAALGIHPYYLDQQAGLNNFLQNVIIGGRKPNGDDATNDCTYLILKAFMRVNLSTPGLYIRLHSDSPEELYMAVSESLKETKNLPAILNDDVMIPALYNSLIVNVESEEKKKKYKELANDYCVDGCWEPILNGVSDWTFGMINGMFALECALNRGATLDPTPGVLRGRKTSPDTGTPNTFEELKEALAKQIQFFTDQSVLGMCLYFLTTEYVVPTPLVSALFDSCIDRGRDISWGGAAYNLGGTIVGGVPDMINTLAAIREWVFEKEKYNLALVVDALKNNYKANGKFKDKQDIYNQMKIDFDTNSPQWGNTAKVDDIVKFLLDTIYEASENSKRLAEKLFICKDSDEDLQVWALRAITGYYGESIQNILPDFEMKFTVGLGTFEQYNWQGAGIAASAGREANAPLAPNFSPTSGTLHNPPSVLISKFKKLELDRFAGGVITDVCIQDPSTIHNLLKEFIINKGNMLTITVASDTYKTIYEIAKKQSEEKTNGEVRNELLKYSDIMVRVGGWNAPFITLPLSHMENYIKRSSSEKK